MSAAAGSVRFKLFGSPAVDTGVTGVGVDPWNTSTIQYATNSSTKSFTYDSSEISKLMKDVGK